MRTAILSVSSRVSIDVVFRRDLLPLQLLYSALQLRAGVRIRRPSGHCHGCLGRVGFRR